MADELAHLQAEIAALNSEAADRAISLVIELGTLYVQQARELERLRAALQQIADNDWSNAADAVDMRRIAMIALGSGRALAALDKEA